MEYRCTICNEIKGVDSFYPSHIKEHHYRCKDCLRIKHRKLSKDWRRKNSDRANNQSKKYRDNNPKKRREIEKLYAENNREKRLAKNIARHAMDKGIIIKKPCEKCGSLNSQKHHEDYSRPLDVTWLCPMCHQERHANLKYGIIK